MNIHIKNIRRRLFNFSVKTLYIPVSILVALVLVLAVSSNSFHSFVYYKTGGSFDIPSEEPDTVDIVADIDARLHGLINRNSRVIWYIGSEGKRYKGRIKEIGDIKGNSFKIRVETSTLELKPEQLDCYGIKGDWNEVRYDINLEILIKKKKLLDN